MLDAHLMYELSGRLNADPVASQEQADHLILTQAAQLHSCVQTGILQPAALHPKTCKIGTPCNAVSGVVGARVSCAGALQDLQTEWQQ